MSSALESTLESTLLKTWAEPPGVRGLLTSVDHKTIGRRYLVTAFAFFLAGGLEAALMRLQLARPLGTVVGPDLYAQLFSMHGSTMMFLFAVPVTQGLAIYIVPLAIGTRTVAFPRLLAYSYLVYLIGGLLLYGGFAFDAGMDAGWFSYVPLAGPQFGAGKRVDIWAQMVTFTELAALAVAVNLIVTILKYRAVGMALSRMPLFVWAALVQSFMVLFGMPAVMVSSTELALDRLVGTHFFNPAEGGDALLWQHLFWFFGHPEVYIIFIPGTGMVSTLVASAARRPVVGYLWMVLALVATGFLGFGLWVHHMFATGLPQLGQSFFTAASLMIVVPSGVQIACWIATLWTGRLRLETPLWWVIGFLLVFVFGGLSGVMLASVPIDLQVHDTHFVVAHLHYVLIGGMVFPLFGAIHHWLPKLTGRMPSERLGIWQFALFFVGFNLVFYPLHHLGLRGMTRRAYSYLPEMAWGGLDLAATTGVALLAASVILFLSNVIWTRRRGAAAGDDPFYAPDLEWSTSSPPPPYNFAVLPTVAAGYPRWTSPPDQPVVVGLAEERREVLVTRVIDAAPDHRHECPGPAWSPLLAALATGLLVIGAIFTPWGAVVGAVPLTAALAAWFWPRGYKGGARPRREAARPRREAARPVRAS
jgi:cytochrome c oxidase subunit 1